MRYFSTLEPVAYERDDMRMLLTAQREVDMSLLQHQPDQTDEDILQAALSTL